MTTMVADQILSTLFYPDGLLHAVTVTDGLLQNISDLTLMIFQTRSQSLRMKSDNGLDSQ